MLSLSPFSAPQSEGQYSQQWNSPDHSWGAVRNCPVMEEVMLVEPWLNLVESHPTSKIQLAP